MNHNNYHYIDYDFDSYGEMILQCHDDYDNHNDITIIIVIISCDDGFITMIIYYDDYDYHITTLIMIINCDDYTMMIMDGVIITTTMGLLRVWL